MLRISIYHWLPLADNMLPDIVEALQEVDRSGKPSTETDSIYYSLPLELSIGTLILEGKINQRGFAQNVIQIPPIHGKTLAKIIEEIVPEIRVRLADILFDIVPLAVRNKLAVLNENIVSFQEFESNVFDPLIDVPAKSFLKVYHLTSILIGEEYAQDMRTGFKVLNIALDVDKSTEKVRSIPNSDGSVILFFSDKFSDDEGLIFDSVIYKLCALIAFSRFCARVIYILKQVRDHVIPLRRRLTIALQRNTEEHFSFLTRVKKYLTYVNIKLPVVQKVLNHMLTASISPQFAAKENIFRETSQIDSFPSIGVINQQFLQPLYIIDRIKEDVTRIEPLFKEDMAEINIISDELSKVLEGSLMAENVQIAARELDTSLSSLELDRGGKNRANALKIFSFLVAANLGFTLAAEIGLEGWKKVAIGAATTLAAWYLTNWVIKNKSSSMRLVIPFNASVARQSLSNFTWRNRLKRSESNGTRRLSSWTEAFETRHPEDSTRKRSLWKKFYLLVFPQKFDVAIDYEKRGYIHSIAIATEHNDLEFDILDIVIQTLDKMHSAGCMDSYKDQETSLLAHVLVNMDIYMDKKLTSLNGILLSPTLELRRSIHAYQSNSHEEDISTEDRQFVLHIIENKNEYMNYLLGIQQKKTKNAERLLRLLGEKNVSKKIEEISQIRNQEKNRGSAITSAG